MNSLFVSDRNDSWRYYLPEEVLLRIFQMLSESWGLRPTISSTALVCRLWYRVSQSPLLWRILDLNWIPHRLYQTPVLFEQLCYSRLTCLRHLSLTSFPGLCEDHLIALKSSCVNKLSSLNLHFQGHSTQLTLNELFHFLAALVSLKELVLEVDAVIACTEPISSLKDFCSTRMNSLRIFSLKQCNNAVLGFCSWLVEDQGLQLLWLVELVLHVRQRSSHSRTNASLNWPILARAAPHLQSLSLQGLAVLCTADVQNLVELYLLNYKQDSTLWPSLKSVFYNDCGVLSNRENRHGASLLMESVMRCAPQIRALTLLASLEQVVAQRPTCPFSGHLYRLSLKTEGLSALLLRGLFDQHWMSLEFFSLSGQLSERIDPLQVFCDVASAALVRGADLPALSCVRIYGVGLKVNYLSEFLGCAAPRLSEFAAYLGDRFTMLTSREEVRRVAECLSQKDQLMGLHRPNQALLALN